MRIAVLDKLEADLQFMVDMQSLDEEVWRTINGTHVKFDESGEIIAGPRKLTDWSNGKKKEKHLGLYKKMEQTRRERNRWTEEEEGQTEWSKQSRYEDDYRRELAGRNPVYKKLKQKADAEYGNIDRITQEMERVDRVYASAEYKINAGRKRSLTKEERHIYNDYEDIYYPLQEERNRAFERVTRYNRKLDGIFNRNHGNEHVAKMMSERKQQGERLNAAHENAKNEYYDWMVKNKVARENKAYHGTLF